MAKQHASHVTGWITDRIDYAMAVLCFLVNGSTIEDKWHKEPPPVTAEAMAKLLPLVLDGKKFESRATAKNVLEAIHDARAQNKVAPLVGRMIALLDEMKASLDNILQAPPPELQRLDRELADKHGIKKKSETAKLTSWVFDYDWWVADDGTRVSWRASDLAKMVHVRTCPYCNRHYVYSVPTVEGGILRSSQFDHFFSQGDHPLLKMSFYNLVPVCSLCNSPAYKGQTDFALDANIHPFEEGFGDDYVFRIKGGLDGSEPLDWIENAEQLPLVLESQPNADPSKQRRCVNQKDVFKLVPLYGGHGVEVAQTIRQYRDYNRKRVAAIAQDSAINLEQDEAARLLWGDTSLKGLEKQTLSKLRRDILAQLQGAWA